jgi:hypothetical protein
VCAAYVTSTCAVIGVPQVSGVTSVSDTTPSTIRYAAKISLKVQDRAVLCCAVLCCAVLCCAVLCCAVLCCAVLCCAFLSDGRSVARLVDVLCRLRRRRMRVASTHRFSRSSTASATQRCSQ